MVIAPAVFDHPRSTLRFGQERAGFDDHIVEGKTSARLTVVEKTGTTREVLIECPPERDVKHLHAPTNGEKRQADFHRSPSQRQLQRIAFRKDAVHVFVRFGAVQSWVNVSPAHEDETVNASDHGVGIGVRNHPWGKQRFDAAGPPDRVQIRALHDRCVRFGPSGNLTGVAGTGAHPDKWTDHASSLASAHHRSKFRRSSQSVTALLNCIHSWRAVVTK